MRKIKKESDLNDSFEIKFQFAGEDKHNKQNSDYWKT